MARKHKIQNLRSNVLNKKPLADEIDYGEIGVNYNKDSAALYIKNDNDEIIKVSGEGAATLKYYTETDDGAFIDYSRAGIQVTESGISLTTDTGSLTIRDDDSIIHNASHVIVGTTKGGVHVEDTVNNDGKEVTTVKLSTPYSGIELEDINGIGQTIKMFNQRNTAKLGEHGLTVNNRLVLTEGDAYTKTETDDLLDAKQDVITDLDTIRSGAEAGATAVQPAALDGKQDVITDLDTIRSGAAAGATAVQTETDPVWTAEKGSYYTKTETDGLLSGKQDQITDLAEIRDGAAAGATAVQPAALDGKQDVITDLDTIRSGAAAGATAVQTADLNKYATKIIVNGNEGVVTNNVASVTIDSSNMVYEGTTSVKNGIDELMDAVFPLTFTKGSNNGGTYEVGQSINGTATFSITKKGQAVPGKTITVNPNEGSFSGYTWSNSDITSDKTYTFKVDGSSVAAQTVSYAFKYYRFFGQTTQDIITTNVKAETYLTSTLRTSSSNREWFTSPGKNGLHLYANEYYMFALPSTTEGKTYEFSVVTTAGGTVTGTLQGECEVQLVNSSRKINYAYVVVPKSTLAWDFNITATQVTKQVNK